MSKKIIAARRFYGWRPEPLGRNTVALISDLRLFSSGFKNILYPALPVFDQLTLQSCTANAIATAHQLCQFRQGVTSPYIPSRLFIYYNARKSAQEVAYDRGAGIETSLKALKEYGVCPESMWPYYVGRLKEKPPSECYGVARENKGIKYESLRRDLTAFKDWLDNGKPFIFGFYIYPDFEDGDTPNSGIVTLPKPGQKKVDEAGHAVAAVGYIDGYIIFVNSKGEWGKNGTGIGYMPFDYILNPDYAQNFFGLQAV
jgi:C1A family cysteine protease